MLPCLRARLYLPAGRRACSRVRHSTWQARLASPAAAQTDPLPPCPTCPMPRQGTRQGTRMRSNVARNSVSLPQCPHIDSILTHNTYATARGMLPRCPGALMRSCAHAGVWLPPRECCKKPPPFVRSDTRRGGAYNAHVEAGATPQHYLHKSGCAAEQATRAAPAPQRPSAPAPSAQRPSAPAQATRAAPAQQ